MSTFLVLLTQVTAMRPMSVILYHQTLDCRACCVVPIFKFKTDLLWTMVYHDLIVWPMSVHELPLLHPFNCGQQKVYGFWYEVFCGKTISEGRIDCG